MSLSSPSNKKPTGNNAGPQKSKMNNVNQNSLSQPKKQQPSNNNYMYNMGPMGMMGGFGMGMNNKQMQEFMIARRTHGVSPFLKKKICYMAKVTPPANGQMPPPPQLYGMGFKIRRIGKWFSHDLDWSEGVAMCHNKEMEHRGCEKTPSSKFKMFPGMGMGGMGGMGGMMGGMMGSRPMASCDINKPNSCGNPALMKCSRYHKDRFGIPVCCATSEMTANQLENMGF
uniref:MRNP protein n=1 Tax=Pinctada imbricata TaxID=66713 RepID=A0A097F710_PINIB|nr:MRNP protein [Pinctada imbricata]